MGGYLGLMLHEAGQDVSLIDRGEHYHTIHKHGLTLEIAGEVRSAKIPCTDRPESLPPQDCIFIAVKTYALPEILPFLTPLMHDNTIVVNVNNGIPWWYFHGMEGSGDLTYLESVDPGGAQWRNIHPERAIGCVAFPACQLVSPGVIRHISGNRFALGEPSGEKSERLLSLVQTLRDAGVKVAIKSRIRDEVWVKLWGNLAFNPISVLTGATLAQICQDSDTRHLARDMMLEASDVASVLGVRFSIDVDKRINGAEQVGEHKTSMLQDYEAGQPLETGALLTAVQELGQRVDVATPTIDRVAALLALKVASQATNCAHE